MINSGLDLKYDCKICQNEAVSIVDDLYAHKPSQNLLSLISKLKKIRNKDLSSWVVFSACYKHATLHVLNHAISYIDKPHPLQLIEALFDVYFFGSQVEAQRTVSIILEIASDQDREEVLNTVLYLGIGQDKSRKGDKSLLSKYAKLLLKSMRIGNGYDNIDITRFFDEFPNIIIVMQSFVVNPTRLIGQFIFPNFSNKL